MSEKKVVTDKKREAFEKKTSNRSLGTIKSKSAGGMWVTSTGDKIPAYPNIKEGEKVEIKNGELHFPEREEEQIVNDTPVSREEFEAMKTKSEAMERFIEENLGDKGSNVKATTGADK